MPPGDAAEALALPIGSYGGSAQGDGRGPGRDWATLPAIGGPECRGYLAGTGDIPRGGRWP